MTGKTANLKSIAEAAGVSIMTVSRVLNNHPKVSESTRKKVWMHLEKEGYTPDPHMHRLMKIIRGRKKTGWRSTIAVIRDFCPYPAYRFVNTADIRNRATLHGYNVEEFILNPEKLSAQRLYNILVTRGIEGLIIYPPIESTIYRGFDFTPFASVTFGYIFKSPNLHRVSTNLTEGILSATKNLTLRGYKKIGLVLTEWIDARAEHTYSGALLRHQMDMPPKAKIPVLLLPEANLKKGKTPFLHWFKKHRPDAIISFDHLVPGWLEKDLGLRIPEDIGFVTHDWSEESGSLAGIDHRREIVAEAAVDLLANHLLHNETGIPSVPKQILIPPRFIEGESIQTLQIQSIP